MPVFNGAKHLAEAIDSVLDQTFTRFEFIIINDGSTDATEHILSTYNDVRIRVIHCSKNLGLVNALNLGVKSASSDLIVRMDADDVSMPERFELQYNFMEQNPEVLACGTSATAKNSSFFALPLFDSYDMPTGSIDLEFRMIFECPLIHPSAIIRKNVFDMVGLYRSEWLHAEDFDLWIRVAKLGKIQNLPERLLVYRVHNSGISIKYKRKQLQQASILRKRAFKYFELKLRRKTGFSSFGEILSDDADVFIGAFIKSIPYLGSMGVSRELIDHYLWRGLCSRGCKRRHVTLVLKNVKSLKTKHLFVMFFFTLFRLKR
jgi:glycosyltransferase involved in cell wall biosynthesis